MSVRRSSMGSGVDARTILGFLVFLLGLGYGLWVTTVALLA
ncbi:MAG: hypothetical protein ABEJ88_04685 [Halobacterium sp.]